MVKTTVEKEVNGRMFFFFQVCIMADFLFNFLNDFYWNTSQSSRNIVYKS